MKLVPVKQAQAKVFNAPADKGLKSLTLATFKKDRSLTLERDGEGCALTSSSHSVRRRKPLSGLFIKFAARGDGVGV